MFSVDRFFEPPEPVTHPRVQGWRYLLEERQADRLRVEFCQERNGLALGPPSLRVLFQDHAGRDMLAPEEVEWDAEINEQLLALGVRAVTPANEARRFGLMMVGRFVLIDTRFRDRFSSDVLAYYLLSSPWGTRRAIRGRLATIEFRHPIMGPFRDACVAAIEDLIGGYIRVLFGPLGYTRDETMTIVAGAIADYLDERFWLVERQIFGFA